MTALLVFFAAALFQDHTVHAAPNDPADTPASLETSAYSGEPDAEVDELDGDEDGSQALHGDARTIDVKRLQPVNLDEEQTLLGDWGDSENED